MKGNSDEWFVQTSNTSNELIRHLGVPSEKVKLYPFYKRPKQHNTGQKPTDYIFVGEFTGSKGHWELLEAWRILHEQGFDRNLHITVSMGEGFLNQVTAAVKEGVKVVNHGFIPSEQLSALYQQSKATVYPSFNESFGLGLVEAMEAGCDVIASDRPYVYSICDPSEVFDPKSPRSIADAVIRYESGHSPKTKQSVENCIDEMIRRIEG